MKVNRFLVLLFAGVLGCASSEGGVVGSGISSVSGNVTLVQEEATVQTSEVSLPFPIRVGIVESTVESDTDAEGNFELMGEFSGEVTLRFFDASADRRLGDFRLEVPAGSTTVLQNIEIDVRPMIVRPEAVQQFDFLGRIEMAECESDGSGVLLVRDEGPSQRRRQFMVRLVAASDIRRDDGQSLLCQDLRQRDLLLIDGVLLTDRTVAGLRVVVSPSTRPSPGIVVRPVEVRGRVVRIGCAAGGMEVEELRVDQPLRQQIRFTPSTEFVCLEPNQRSCACQDIQVGDLVAVEGVIRTNRPGAVEATFVTVSTGARQVSLVGIVLRRFCGDGVVQIMVGDRERLRLLLSPATSIVCGDPPLPCGCEDIPIDRTISVQGTVRLERPGVVDSTLIRAPRLRGLRNED